MVWIMRSAAVVATAAATLPLVYLVVRATERGWPGVKATLVRPHTVDLTVRSLELAAIVTALTVVIGVALAWLVTRTDLPLRRGVQVAAGLPLALPSFVAAWSWIGFRPELAGRSGAVIVLTTISYPYVYLPTMAALRRCDPALEDTARSLGHSRWSVLWRVTLPQIRPATVGGRYPVLTHAIYMSYRASFDRTPAAVLGCVLAALTLVIVFVEHRTRRHQLVARVGAGAARNQSVIRLGRWRWPALALPVSVVGVSLGVPALGMYRWFSRGSSRADTSELLRAMVNTLQVSALAALAVVALVTPVAVLSVRHPGRLARAAERAAYAGHALPGVVVGLSLVFFGIRAVPSLYQRIPLLVLAYVVLFMSLGLGAIQAAVAQVPPALEDVARTLGRGPLAAWTSVTLRLSAPGIGAAATLVFLTAMKELPAALFLRPTGFDTLSTRLWSHVSSLSYAAAAPYAVTIVVLAAVPTALLATIGDRRSRP